MIQNDLSYTTGGIFDVDDLDFRTGFRYAVSRYNGKVKNKFTFESLEENSTVSDSFNITYQCEYMYINIHFIISMHITG